jgi:hypothetical protein
MALFHRTLMIDERRAFDGELPASSLSPRALSAG